MKQKMTRALIAVCALLGSVLSEGLAQAASPAQDSAALRLLASRAELEGVAQRLGGRDRLPAHTRSLRDEAARRLRDGDFKPGDLVLLEVQGEPLLSDTFTVDISGGLTLPSPAVGPLSMRGILRSELGSHVATFLGRFIQQPVIRARSLVRLSLEGEVTRAGFYAVPADATLSDAVMSAHGVTVNGDLGKVKITRNGRAVLEGQAMRDAIARGMTIDDARLKEGDQVSVGRGRGDLEGKLRFLWVVVSLAGGIYGLTRAF